MQGIQLFCPVANQHYFGYKLNVKSKDIISQAPLHFDRYEDLGTPV
jgi:hypothetical protein